MKSLIYTDTGVLLGCILLQQCFTKVNSERKFNIKKIDSDKAEFLISNISLIELTEKLKDSKASLLAINDALYFLVADKEDCNIFITNDEKLRKRLKN